jgi:hypothetical protein
MGASHMTWFLQTVISPPRPPTYLYLSEVVRGAMVLLNTTQMTWFCI